VRARPEARGKFLWAGEEKFYVRGVTYGAFAPNSAGEPYPEPEVVEQDFARMADSGINTVRTYDAPPRWLLDLASEHGLWVMVGLPWEQHVTFLDDARLARSIERRVRNGVHACSGHAAVLCYVIGNEIPSSIVRWHGRHRVERFIKRLYHAAKREDPNGLFTYANYPSTEYLQLPFLDIACFNVFLESEPQLGSYLARLQTLAANRPLVITELGLDSRRHGIAVQASSIGSQLGTVFRAGCAGAVVFSWSDDWHRGDLPVDDWDFGLVRRDRTAKPALAAVKRAFAKAPFERATDWPFASVIVCTHNGATTLSDCLDGISQLDYPDYEVIVVDDGSTDGTSQIAAGFDVRLIRTPQQGLAAARNTGLAAARGEIVAYIDDDAWPDPDWLSYLALDLRGSKHVGVGGPNIPPPGHTAVADCVSRAPGGPIHVLLSDSEAEHIPGCNMAFRRDALEAIGGFDPQFWVAGDDVDLCWRLQAMGWTLGFSPAALVWHRSRASVRTYLRQQVGYGKAEALLERKWPERYNGGGHLKWAGHVYGDGAVRLGSWRWRIYYGRWGAGLFQSMYERPAGLLAALPLMPQWYLLIAFMALLSAGGLLWPPLLLRLPWLGLPTPLLLLATSIGFLLAQAFVAGWRTFSPLSEPSARRLGNRLLTGLLHFLQPLARIWGRLRHGLTPWRRRRREFNLAAPWAHSRALWSERRQPAAAWLTRLESDLRRRGADVRRGGAFDRWDLEASGGALAAARLRVAIEEHGQGRQLVRFRVWPRLSAAGAVLITTLSGLLYFAFLGRSGTPAVAVLAFATLLAAVRAVSGAAAAVGVYLYAVGELPPDLLSTTPSVSAASSNGRQTSEEPGVEPSAEQGLALVAVTEAKE
jgi:GT2 family glycosyltransferase